MVFIDRASTNYLYLTLREKEELTAPYYLIKFVCVSTKDVRYCWCTDSSSYPDRYQKLTVVETNSPTSGTNQVKLDTKSVWEYYVYEYDSSDPTPTDETGLNEVEQGQVTINRTQTTLQSYNGYQSTYKKYT